MRKVMPGLILIGTTALLLLSTELMFAQLASSEQSRSDSTTNTNESLEGTVIFRGQSVPSGTGSPGSPTRTSGGRTRTDSCLTMNPQAANQQMAALIPLDPKTGISYGITTQERPTLWIYIPGKSTSQAYGELVVQDDNEQIVHRQRAISLSGTPGVIRIPLSASAPPLEIGKTYRWYFSTYCKSTNLSESTQFVGGYLQRQSLNPVLQDRLKQAPLAEQVKLYAENGVWYEALKAAANLQQTTPRDRSWGALLQAVGLENLATEPITNCCKRE